MAPRPLAREDVERDSAIPADWTQNRPVMWISCGEDEMFMRSESDSPH